MDNKLSAVVQISLEQLMGMNKETLPQACLMLALGSDEMFKYRVEDYQCRLAGILDLNILFEVTGTLHEIVVQTKSDDKKPKRIKEKMSLVKKPRARKIKRKRG